MSTSALRSAGLSSTRGASTAPGVDLTPSYRAASVAGLVVFAIYMLTLAPSTAMWDASEYIAAAYILGLPHPPGNPFFVLIGNVFAHAPIPGTNPAMRVNILAALCSAVTAGMWFLIVERVLAHWFTEKWQRLVGASLAAILGATAFTVWNQSVVNEKVYTVSLVFFGVVSWLTVRWCDDPDGPTADRILVLIAYLVGLGYTNHPAGFLVVPAVGVAVLARRAKVLLRWRLLLACFGALCIGLTVFAMMPIRAAHFPAINEGEPTGCVTEIGVDCTFSATTWKRLKANIDREQYGKPSLVERQAPFSAQVGMWWLYFKWQWLRDSDGNRPAIQHGLAMLFLMLGGLGGWVHYKKDRQSFWFFGPLIFTVTFLLVYYMNFKYGYSQAPELGSQVPREVRDRDYFYLWSFSAWSVWATLGLVWIWRTLAEAVGRSEAPDRRAMLATIPVLAIGLIPLLGNWSAASRAGHLSTRNWAHDLLNSVEPYGILVTGGDNDTFPLWYAQEVEGIRQDVTVAVTSLLNTDWYVRGLIRRPVYEYDAAKGPEVYRGQQWAKPTRPVISFTIPQADSLPQYMQLPGPQLFRAGAIEATVDPQRLQYGVLERADILVLQMLKDNLGTRPLYISRSTGGYGESLGLERYLLTQGLARKVSGTPLVAGRDTVIVESEGFVDVPRTLALWTNVFEFPESIVEEGNWVDRASANTPAAYVATGLVLAEALARRGDTQGAERIVAAAENIAAASRTTEWFFAPGRRPPLPSPETDTPPRTAVPLDSPTR